MKLLAASLILLFTCVALRAGQVPRALCDILMAQGATAAQIEDYFAEAKDHVYDHLRPELRARLVKASIAMMSLRSAETGKLEFTGENWGMTGVAHLWLLGLSAEEIADHTRPLVSEYLATFVKPRVAQLKRAREFQQAQGALREASVASSAAGLQNLVARAPSSLERDFSESVSGWLFEHLQGALLAGLRNEALTLAEYMVLLDATDESVVYALEKLGLAESLFQLGVNQFDLAMQKLAVGQIDYKLRLALATAVESLARIPEGNLKQNANHILFSIGTLLSSPSFAELFPNREEVKLHYYDIALSALLATGRISHRTVERGTKEVIHYRPVTRPDVALAIRKVAEGYLQITDGVSEAQFAVLRRALVALDDSGWLIHAGDSMLSRSRTWTKTYHPYHVFAPAFEFYLAAGARAEARKALETWLDVLEQGPVAPYAADPYGANRDVESIMRKAHAASFGDLYDRAMALVLRNGWVSALVVEDELARSAHTKPAYALVPHFPSGLRDALNATHWSARYWEHGQRLDAEQTALTLDMGRTAESAGSLDAAVSYYVLARSAPDLIRAGDAMLARYEDPVRGGLRRLAVGAHQAYLWAALLEAKPLR